MLVLLILLAITNLVTSDILHDVIDGDVLVKREKRDVLSFLSRKKSEFISLGRSKRQVSLTYPKWTDDTLYYIFDTTISDAKKQLLMGAMQHIADNTCIKFADGSNKTNRVKFTNGDGCASYIGMIGGTQSIYFSDDCMLTGIGIHEIMHALGVYHEHSRYDRDDYINVNLANVPASSQSNFNKLTNKVSYNPYNFEYGSTMLYSVNSFGTGSMNAKNSDYKRTMGFRKGSFLDMKMLNNDYDCDCDSDPGCENGGYPNPNDCSQCLCTDGFGGPLCNENAVNQIQLTATSSFVSKSISFGLNTTITSFYQPSIAIYAPSGKTIQFQFTSLSNFYCMNGCNMNGVEIKYLTDRRITNPIICCFDTDQWSRVYNTTNNPLIINLHTRMAVKAIINFQYRYV